MFGGASKPVDGQSNILLSEGYLQDMLMNFFYIFCDFVGACCS